MNRGVATGLATDASGYVSIAHGLGVKASVVVTGWAQNSISTAKLALMHSPGGDTVTTFRLAVSNVSDGSALISTSIVNIEWVAFK